MRFERRSGDVWLLIDEAAPPDACVIATVRGSIEVLALKGLCEVYLASTGQFEPFEFTHEGHRYRATPFSDRGGKLSLRIDGSDGTLSRVETEFAYRQ